MQHTAPQRHERTGVHAVVARERAAVAAVGVAALTKGRQARHPRRPADRVPGQGAGANDRPQPVRQLRPRKRGVGAADAGRDAGLPALRRECALELHGQLRSGDLQGVQTVPGTLQLLFQPWSWLVRRGVFSPRSVVFTRPVLTAIHLCGGLLSKEITRRFQQLLALSSPNNCTKPVPPPPPPPAPPVSHSVCALPGELLRRT